MEANGSWTPTLEEWAILARAISKNNHEARRVLARLLQYHGVTLEKLDARLDRARPPEPPVPRGGWPDLVTSFQLDEEAEIPLPLAAASEPVLLWELVGGREELRIAAEQAGLDPNVVRPATEGSDEEAVIAHPSVFCPDEVRFLGAIAVLLRRRALFRLYRVRRAEGAEADTVLVRLFPEPGSETMAVLEAFHPDMAPLVRDLSARVAGAMRLLEEQS